MTMTEDESPLPSSSCRYVAPPSGMGFGWGRGVPYKRGVGLEACSPTGKLVWRMSSEGEIRTCFISARLPSWAGVRQGVAGTNVNGGVVGAPAQSGVLAYSRFVQQQQQQPGTAATGSVFRAVFPSVDLSAEVGMMRQALAELRQQLQELREVVDMQLRGTASEAAEEEEEEEIVVDEEVAPGAGASTMEEEEDEMVLTMTVVGGPEPAGVEAQPPPPPTPERDPAVPATTTTPSGAATEEQEERSMRGDN